MRASKDRNQAQERISLCRLTGIPVEGRGYGLRRAKEGLDYDYKI